MDVRGKILLLGLVVALYPGLVAAEPQDHGVARAVAFEPSSAPDLSDALDAAGWRLFEVPGRPPARFASLGPDRLSVSSDGGVGFLYRPLAPEEAGRQRLSWHWRVTSAPPPTDLSEKGADDRPLAVHLWFPEPPEEASLWSDLKGAMGRLFDVPVPGKVLTYVWGGTQGRGDKLVNPHLEDDGVLIVLRSGHHAPDGWVREEIDIVADFTMAFGYPPPPASYLAISADSDDRLGRTRGQIKDIRFDS